MRSTGQRNPASSVTGVLLFVLIGLAGLSDSAPARAESEAATRSGETSAIAQMRSHLTETGLVRDIVDHPAFAGFGAYLLPRDDSARDYDTPIVNIGSLMPYHSHVDVPTVVSALNHMIDEVNAGRTVFFRYYAEREMQADPAKRSTGLFFFRGKPGAPFAVVCPGGGFAYVGSLHEGFPHAVEISASGYNAFVLKYRVGSESSATEDLAAAITFIMTNADRLEVGVGGYSLWGSSAGARMVGNIALNGVARHGGGDVPKPSAAVIAYTGHSSFSGAYPATFVTVSEDDRIANSATVDERVANLKSAGVAVEYRKFKRAGHGFGIGVGTDAEGWVNDAIRFWERQQR